MWRASTLHYGLAAVALMLVGGCEIIAAPDASLLTGGGGGVPVATTTTNATTSVATSSSSASGQGGAGGSDCTPVDDDNQCTTDLCRDGVPVHDPVAVNEPCDAGICDGAGQCVGCIVPDTCPGNDTTCRTRTCEQGVCGFDFADAGTETNTQVIGDCKVEVCDGAGEVVTQNADVDLPDDMNDCTDDVCTAGVPSNPPRPEDTPCGAGMMLACNATGQCVGCGAPDDCAGSDDECKQRTCENMICGVDFTANHTPVADQDDGNCLVAVCDGAGNTVDDVDDQDLPDDDGIACTDEVCVAGVPGHPALPDNAICDDGNGCTTADTCQAGTCVAGDPVVCAAQDQCHDAGTCDMATGACSNPAKPDGDACNDATACTQDDSCQAGVCVGEDPVTCTAQDQCHDAGTCDALTGMCSNPAKPDGDACNDGNACSQSDTCQAGVCDGQNPVVCTALDQCHQAGTCDPGTGTCSNPVRPDGFVCNDGNACSQTDTCQTGTCTGADPVVCGAPGVCHDQGTCNPVSGMCSDPTSPDGTACTTGGQPASCTGGACLGGESEPNDVCPAASGPITLAFGVPVSVNGAITPIGDRDRWAFVLPARGGVRIETFTGNVVGTCAVADTHVRLKNTNCTSERGNDDDEGVDSCSLIDPAANAYARNLPAGTYYFEVEEFGNNAAIAQYGAEITMVSQCGNATQEVGEACDDGNVVNGDTCDENCTLPACGNGVRGGAEACDDGNTSNADGCSSVCSTEVGFSCAGSPSVCTPICGDGLRLGSEQCDDNNTVGGDGCSPTCQIETTAEVEPNGTCATATPLPAISGPIGVVASGGITPVADNDWFSFVVPAYADVRLETFDNVGPLGTCASFDSEIQLFAGDCTTPVGPVQDQGGIANCSRIDPTVLSYAQHLAPGTYNVRVNEFGNNATFAAYRLQVRFTALCGDGQVQGSEQCDGGASCDATCRIIATCGDGILSAGETCDDGNTVAADGCSATCQTEASFACVGLPSVCGGICGDATTISHETCDDGNTVGQDACDSGCVVEAASAPEVEPNGTPAEADNNVGVTYAGQSFSFTGAITPIADRDLTRFVLPADSIVHLETFSAPGDCATGVTTTLRLLNGAGTQLYTDNTSGIRSCSAITAFLPAGTYYLSVTEAGDNGTVASYILEAKVLPVAALESEANETTATADGFDRAQGYVAGGHQTAGDVDTYAVFVPAGKDLRVELIEGSTAETCESNGIDSLVRVLNAAGTSIGTDSDDGRGFCSLIDGSGGSALDSFAANLTGGVYFIQVSGEGSSVPGQQFDYRLTVMVR